MNVHPVAEGRIRERGMGAKVCALYHIAPRRSVPFGGDGHIAGKRVKAMTDQIRTASESWLKEIVDKMIHGVPSRKHLLEGTLMNVN